MLDYIFENIMILYLKNYLENRQKNELVKFIFNVLKIIIDQKINWKKGIYLQQ